MHIHTRHEGDIIIVELKGKLTAGLGDQILREALAEIVSSGWQRILLVLSEVSTIDSAGLGELVAGLRAVQSAGARLKLANPSHRAHSTLYIAKLLPIFEVHASVDEALAQFRGEAP